MSIRKNLFLLISPLVLIGCGCSKQPAYHTITFHSAGGSSIPTQRVLDGELAIEPKDPAKDAFIFAGWYTEETSENYFNFTKKITQDYNLYARWEGEFEYKVTLDSEDKLELEKDGGFFDQNNYTSRILLKDAYRNKYDLPYSEDYYEVTVNDRPIDNFKIERVVYGSELEYYVNITIPKKSLGSVIRIKTKPYCHYLTFKGEEADAKIYYRYPSNPPDPLPQIEYSYSLDNPIWQTWNAGSENTVTLSEGQSIFVKNKISTLSFEHERVSFRTESDESPKISADGNVMSLINFGELYDFCFNDLFADCFSLTSSPVFPSTTLANACYIKSFDNCHSLLTPPILPAKKLKNSCYGVMFRNCSLLETAPRLPAQELEESCYGAMFMFCTNLKIPPLLPAKNLIKDCYRNMFTVCTNLKISESTSNSTKFFECPDILPDDCVDQMFTQTGGDFTDTPTAGNSYYYSLED